jgi:hypothetical protein
MKTIMLHVKFDEGLSIPVLRNKHSMKKGANSSHCQKVQIFKFSNPAFEERTALEKVSLFRISFFF